MAVWPKCESDQMEVAFCKLQAKDYDRQGNMNLLLSA